MKRSATILVVVLLATFFSCKRNELYQYVDDKPIKPFYEPSPFGMSYISRGSFVIGADDEINDEATPQKRVSVESFWMDETEITNNEYRQFVYWVRDSIARTILSETFPEFMMTEDVITSYSIHYTKLYDFSGLFRCIDLVDGEL